MEGSAQTLTAGPDRYSCVVAGTGRLSLQTVLVSVVVLAGACGASSDAKSWDEAESDGRLQPSFMRACIDANAAAGGEVDFTPQQLEVYCECSFVSIVEYFGGEINDGRLSDSDDAEVGRDFEAFVDLESILRDEPEAIPVDIDVRLRNCERSAS